MGRLDELPQALRKRIFRYLLVADNVRQPPDYLLLIEHYHFEVNLLRVSRAIKDDASAILYGENKFVRLVWYFRSQAHEAMLNHEVPFFKKVKYFNRQIAEITIKSDERRMGRGNLELAVVLLDDIPKISRLLRILDLANFCGFNIGFNLRRPALPIAEQEKLLLPFQQVRGTFMLQKVTIIGSVDGDLARCVRQAMMQQIQWLRGLAWEIFDLLVSMTRTGDVGFRLSKADGAMNKYCDASDFLKSALQQNHMIVESRGMDLEFTKAMARFTVINETNISHLATREAFKEPEGKWDLALLTRNSNRIEEYEKLYAKVRNGIPDTAFARYYYLIGIAELALGHPNKAGKGFAKAYKFLELDLVKEGYEAAKAWPKLSTEQRKNRLNTIISKMPTTPLELPEMKPYMVPQAASEHWVMRQLGCKGPIPYEDMIKQGVSVVLTTKPHPNQLYPGPRTARIGEVNPEILNKIVESYRAQINHPNIPKGMDMLCWVSLTADDIGEASIWDDPELANLVREMANMWEGAMD